MSSELTNKFLPDDIIDTHDAFGLLPFVIVKYGCLCDYPNITAAAGQKSVSVCLNLSFLEY